MDIYKCLFEAVGQTVTVEGRRYKIRSWKEKGFIRADAQILDPKDAHERKFEFLDIIRSESELTHKIIQEVQRWVRQNNLTHLCQPDR